MLCLLIGRKVDFESINFGSNPNVASFWKEFMSFEILKNNPALIRDGKRLNELIEKYEQQKLELIKLGELISEQTSFKSQYIFADDAFGINGCRIFFNRF